MPSRHDSARVTAKPGLRLEQRHPVGFAQHVRGAQPADPCADNGDF
jgi:hypothetical protein